VPEVRRASSSARRATSAKASGAANSPKFGTLTEWPNRPADASLLRDDGRTLIGARGRSPGGSLHLLVAGALTQERLTTLRPPYRSPTLLLRSLTFSGAATRQSGELVLARRGVFHLDESAFSSELFSEPPVLKTGELALDRRGIVTRFLARMQFVLDDGHWMTGQNLCATGGLV